MITGGQAALAVKGLAALKFFPSDDFARAEIGALLVRMVENPEQLKWLVETMVDSVGEWPGPAQMRGIFCTRFKPRDGKEQWCSIPGFTASDSEMAHTQPKQLDADGREMLALPSAAEMKALPLPAEEIAENARTLETIVAACESATDKDTGHMAIPKATPADRAYSRRLLGHLYGLPAEDGELA